MVQQVMVWMLSPHVSSVLVAWVWGCVDWHNHLCVCVVADCVNVGGATTSVVAVCVLCVCVICVCVCVCCGGWGFWQSWQWWQ